MSSYDDILHLPRPQSRHAKMPLIDRAAQFSPFAALTGYDGIIAETGRQTERCVDLDESAIEELNKHLRTLAQQLESSPTATVTYFRPDERKDGGSYLTKAGQVKKLDTVYGFLEFTDRTRIYFDTILELTV